MAHEKNDNLFIEKVGFDHCLGIDLPSAAVVAIFMVNQCGALCRLRRGLLCAFDFFANHHILRSGCGRAIASRACRMTLEEFTINGLHDFLSSLLKCYALRGGRTIDFGAGSAVFAEAFVTRDMKSSPWILTVKDTRRTFHSHMNRNDLIFLLWEKSFCFRHCSGRF